jgi:hypothetical protein
MKKGIGKLFKSPALLVIAVVVMMAAATLAYAHWSGTAEIAGDVYTGNIGIGWWDAETDDDGVPNDWDIGDDGSPSPGYDRWVGSEPYPCEPDNPDNDDLCEDPLSSSDPAQAYPYDPDLPYRYDKDVAYCQAWPEGEGLLRFYIENGYPSYHCTIAGNMFGTGSVPVMTDGMIAGDTEWFYRDQCDYLAVNPDDWDGPWPDYLVGYDEAGDFEFADFYGVHGDEEGGTPDEPWGDGVYQPGDGEFKVYHDCHTVYLTPVEHPDGYYEVWDFVDDQRKLVMTFGASEGSCGVQVDPFDGERDQFPPEDAKFRVWVHVENDAMQNSNYHLAMKAKFINWNEYEDFKSPFCADANGS